MKRMMISVLALAAVPAFALAQTPNQEKAAQDKLEQQVPEMKNPGGTDKLHPPQKAMDEATPEKPGAADGASTGEGGSSKTWSAQEGETSGNAKPQPQK